MRRVQGRAAGGRPRPARVLALLVTFGVTQGCDLSTGPPTGVTLPGTLDGRDSLPILLAGAVGDFAVAYGGAGSDDELGHDGFVLVSGLMADELHQTIQTFSYVEVDRRATGTSNVLGESVYRDLQRARASAERTAEAYRRLEATAVGALHARNLAGYAYLLLAEGFCGGTPFSRFAADGAIQYGEAESTDEVLGRAVSTYDSVLAGASSVLQEHPTAVDSVETQRNLARLGRARALLDLDRAEEAGADAAQVADGFTWQVEYSGNSPREVNGVNYYTRSQPHYSLADSEGVNGIGFLSGDPRAEADTLVPGVYTPVEYGATASPIVLGSSTEARLIQAEALLRTGDPKRARALLSALRARIGLTSLPDPGSFAGRVTQLFRERAFWLWLTGHRLGDLRRLVRQYARPAHEVFPVGAYSGGPLQYGDQVDLPLDEVNNPRYDPASCDPHRP